jgi:hypothetical protein
MQCTPLPFAGPPCQTLVETTAWKILKIKCLLKFPVIYSIVFIPEGHRERDKERNKERLRQEKEREMMLKEQERLRERDMSREAKEARRREQSRKER